MLIAHKALQTLKAKGIDEYTQFAEKLDDASRSRNYKAYVNLGSLGPDLYYYNRLSSSIKDMLKEGFVQAKGVTPWSYHLHSHRPNEFPLKLDGLCQGNHYKKYRRMVPLLPAAGICGNLQFVSIRAGNRKFCR